MTSSSLPCCIPSEDEVAAKQMRQTSHLTSISLRRPSIQNRCQAHSARVSMTTPGDSLEYVSDMQLLQVTIYTKHDTKKGIFIQGIQASNADRARDIHPKYDSCWRTKKTACNRQQDDAAKAMVNSSPDEFIQFRSCICQINDDLLVVRGRRDQLIDHQS